jgi:hypothetical protein
LPAPSGPVAELLPAPAALPLPLPFPPFALPSPPPAEAPPLAPPVALVPALAENPALPALESLLPPPPVRSEELHAASHPETANRNRPTFFPSCATIIEFSDSRDLSKQVTRRSGFLLLQGTSEWQP